MSLLAFDLLLLGWVALSILLPGCALCYRCSTWRGARLIAYGAAVGIVWQALLGFAVVVNRGARVSVIILSASAALGATFYLWRAGGFRDIARSLSAPVRGALALWAAFVILCVALTHLAVRLPAELPDGRYIFKEDTLPVRLQYLTSLPADNFLPYAVSEYFLRRIPFRKEHPILPGQEVGNRTVLLSLVALPYRAALGLPPRSKGPLPRFNYVKKEWPDTSVLYREDFYRQFLVVGIFLNSLLLLGLIAAFAGVWRDPRILPWAAILFCTNPFLITQTIFIWPKALAGFFLLLAWMAFRRGDHPVIVGAAVALACHAHPLAQVFAAGLGLLYVLRWLRGPGDLRAVILFAASVALVMAPWFAWKHSLHLPSDLLWQNVAGEGTEVALSSPINFLWVRVLNFFRLLAPTMFAVYPFRAVDIIEAVQNCLPGVVGLVLIVPALREAARLLHPRTFAWCAIAGPLAIIVAIFSSPALPVFHGFQVAAGGLVFWGVIALARQCSTPVFWSACFAQLAMNLCLLGMRAYVTGLHFP